LENASGGQDLGVEVKAKGQLERVIAKFERYLVEVISAS